MLGHLRPVAAVEDLIDPVAVLAKLEAGNVPIGSMLCEALHAVRSHLGMEVAFIAEFSEGPRCSAMSMGGPSIWCCVSATPIRWKRATASASSMAACRN